MSYIINTYEKRMQEEMKTYAFITVFVWLISILKIMMKRLAVLKDGCYEVCSFKIVAQNIYLNYRTCLWTLLSINE